VATIASRAGGTPFGTEVLTVAELLRRNGRPAPQAAADDEPLTSAISVGSLLRREGRAPHAADRPVQIRARDLDAADGETEVIARTGPDRRALVRRGAIGAGALLAAGAVLGATVLTDATGEAEQLAAGSYPGQGALDAAPAGQESPATSPFAFTTPAGPDAGVPAPATWMNVAFPAALGGASAPAGVTRTPATTPAGGNTARNAAPAGGTTAPATGTPATSSPTTQAPPSSTTKPQDDSVTGQLGGAVAQAGDSTPLAPVTDAVGDTVSGLGRTAGGTLAPVTAPVAGSGGLVGGLAGGLL
jgi:hypothetical protein